MHRTSAEHKDPQHARAPVMDFFFCLFVSSCQYSGRWTPTAAALQRHHIVLLTIAELSDVPQSLRRAGSIAELRRALPGPLPEPGHPLPKGKPPPTVQAAAAPSHPSPLPFLKGSLRKG